MFTVLTILSAITGVLFLAFIAWGVLSEMTTMEFPAWDAMDISAALSLENDLRYRLLVPGPA
jgi:hypothetical protein